MPLQRVERLRLWHCHRRDRISVGHGFYRTRRLLSEHIQHKNAQDSRAGRINYVRQVHFAFNVPSTSIVLFAGVLVFLWFIGFCYMADQWRQEPNKDVAGWNGRNSVQAAIAFAFFSILAWVCAQV